MIVLMARSSKKKTPEPPPSRFCLIESRCQHLKEVENCNPHRTPRWPSPTERRSQPLSRRVGCASRKAKKKRDNVETKEHLQPGVNTKHGENKLDSGKARFEETGLISRSVYPFCKHGHQSIGLWLTFSHKGNL